MASRRRVGTLIGSAPLLTLATWISFGPCATARAGDPVPVVPVRPGPPGSGYGTLGYGGPGLYPGSDGFGLSYHLGYGYGGNALGVGAEGGYPFYGGPGYPHGTPRLRRFGPITPFPYYGGPGLTCNGRPNVFGPVGPLAVDQPVARENNGSDQGYGAFTGAIPYPDTLFAPYASPGLQAGPSAEADAPSASDAPAPGGNEASQAKAPACGFDEESVVGAAEMRGIKVARVYPGTAAEKSGLQTGDVIHSINGYRTRQRGNVAWIVAEAAPDKVLKMNVQKASDGKVQVVVIQFR